MKSKTQLETDDLLRQLREGAPKTSPPKGFTMITDIAKAWGVSTKSASEKLKKNDVERVLVAGRARGTYAYRNDQVLTVLLEGK